MIKELNELLKILNDLDTAEVNRNVFVNYENDPIIKRELHGFSVGSLHEYGGTNYVKTILQSWKVHTNVFTAISRIASLNLILARLIAKLIKKGCQN